MAKQVLFITNKAEGSFVLFGDAFCLFYGKTAANTQVRQLSM